MRETKRSSGGRAVLGVVATAAAAVLCLALTPGLRAATYQASDESRSHQLINSARSSAGLGSLSDQSGLDSVARAQAARMADAHKIYHNTNLGSDADAAGVKWTWIGENVGVGYDIDELHDGFMNSPPHHENIVYEEYNVLGVGVVIGDDERVYVAQVFATVAGSQGSAQTVQPAPETAAPAPEVSSAPAPSNEAPSAPAQPVRVEAQSTQDEPSPSVPNVLIGGVADLNVVL